MPAGASPKRENEFQELEERFKKEHRYPGREEEVAARIVNKQRAQYGETQAAQQQDAQGTSPDKGLPIKEYETLTIAQIADRLDGLSKADLKKIRAYEMKHDQRKGVFDLLDRASA